MVSHRRARSRGSTCRGAAPASRLDRLSLSGDKRGRSKNLLFAVVNGASFSDPELVTSLCWLAPAVCGKRFCANNGFRREPLPSFAVNSVLGGRVDRAAASACDLDLLQADLTTTDSKVFRFVSRNCYTEKACGGVQRASSCIPVQPASACRDGVASTSKCERRSSASRLVRRTSSCSAMPAPAVSSG